MARITEQVATGLARWLDSSATVDMSATVKTDRKVKALVYAGLTANHLACGCCGLCGKVGGFMWEYEVDHVQNDGNVDRKASKKSAWYLAYLEAKAYGFDLNRPTAFDWTPVTRRFRVVCQPCNSTKNPQTNKCNYQSPPNEYRF